jgi:hypothetical protein
VGFSDGSGCSVGDSVGCKVGTFSSFGVGVGVTFSVCVTVCVGGSVELGSKVFVLSLSPGSA